MAEMKRTQFETLRQSTDAEAAHTKALHAAFQQGEREIREERKEHQRMVQGLRSEIQRHRKELEVSG